MELFPAGDPPDTYEQAAICEAGARGDSMVVKALAGTAKSETLFRMAKRSTKKKILLTAFNKSVVESAKTKIAALGLEKKVDAKTAHSLAYGAAGYKYRDGQVPINSDGAETIGALSEHDLIARYNPSDPTRFASAVVDTIARYCAMRERAIGIEHVPPASREDDPEAIMDAANALWLAFMNVQPDLPIWHDVYLKRYALTDPSLSKRWDAVYFDEAQDASPVMLAVTERQQNIQRVYMGDNNQAVYAFRHAVDALQLVSLPIYELTQCFRFGPNIAEYVNRILAFKGEKIRIKGVAEDPGSVLASRAEEPAMILARTNVGLFTAAFDIVSRGLKVSMGRDFRAHTDLVLSAFDLFRGSRPSHKTLSRFGSWKDLKTASESEQGGQLAPYVKLVEEYKTKIPTLIAKITDGAKSPSKAGVRLSTIHGFKGDSEESIAFAGDLRKPQREGVVDIEEANLWYVAATRARSILILGPMAEMSRDVFGEPVRVTDERASRIVINPPGNIAIIPQPALPANRAPMPPGPSVVPSIPLAGVQPSPSGLPKIPTLAQSLSAALEQIDVSSSGVPKAAEDTAELLRSPKVEATPSSEFPDGGEAAISPVATSPYDRGQRVRKRSFTISSAPLAQRKSSTFPTPIIVDRGNRLWSLHRGARRTGAGWVVPAFSDVSAFTEMMAAPAEKIVLRSARLEPDGEPTVIVGAGLRDRLNEEDFVVLRETIQRTQEKKCFFCGLETELEPHVDLAFDADVSARRIVGLCGGCHQCRHVERSSDDRLRIATLVRVNGESDAHARERLRQARVVLKKRSRRWWILENIPLPKAVVDVQKSSRRAERVSERTRDVVSRMQSRLVTIVNGF